jgi:probable DNA metabolism protein
MRSVILAHEVDFEGWRRTARSLALEGVPPEQVVWAVEESLDLFAEPAEMAAVAGAFSVPRSLVGLAETAIQARDPARFGLLYALIWRAHRGEKKLLEDAADPLVQRVMRLAQAVRRDTHKMRAFLRFREVTEDQATRYVAWFEPDHFIVEANAAFFVRRFATMVFSILTPYRSLHWDGESVRLAPGAQKADVPDDDALEAYWRAYFSNIFNPARIKISAMMSEMPKKYWHNLPEAAAIPELIRDARARTEQMVDTPVPLPGRQHPSGLRPTRPVAVGAICGSTRRRPSLAKGRSMRASCWWESSREIRRTWRGGPSWGRPGRFWIAPCRRPASTAPASM